MLTVRVEKLSELTVIECKGRIIHSDSVFKLRDVVMAQEAPIIVLDLTEVQAIGGGGLGMLAVLDKWAHKHKVHLKLFSPSKAVQKSLDQYHSASMTHFEIASFHEMIGLLAQSEPEYRLAA
jgi:anti-anti-sigma regulatory factor